MTVMKLLLILLLKGNVLSENMHSGNGVPDIMRQVPLSSSQQQSNKWMLFKK